MTNYAYEPLYVAYLVYFNRDQDYFECHEVLEELWLKLDRDPVYKGLLQIAVGLYHFRNGNIRGGYMMLDNAVRKLENLPSGWLGIDMGKLTHEAKDYARKLAAYDLEPFPYADLRIDIIDDELRQAVALASLSIQTNIPQQRGPQRGAKHAERQKAWEASPRRKWSSNGLLGKERS